MEEALEATILLVVMVTFAMVAYAYVLPLSYAQLRGAEIRSAIGVMLTVSNQVTRLLEGDPTGPIDFSFPYGVFDVPSSGNVSVTVNNITIFEGAHSVIRYRTNMGGYPNTFVADRGALPQAFFGSVESASLVYHYSSGGWTYVISDMKVAVSSYASGSSTTLHILVAQIEVEQLALKRGPVQLLPSNRTVVKAIYNNAVNLVVQCGLDSNGSPLTSRLQASGNQVEVFLEVVTIQVQG